MLMAPIGGRSLPAQFNQSSELQFAANSQSNRTRSEAPAFNVPVSERQEHRDDLSVSVSAREAFLQMHVEESQTTMQMSMSERAFQASSVSLTGAEAAQVSRQVDTLSNRSSDMASLLPDAQGSGEVHAGESMHTGYSAEIQSYLQMIQMLSGDKESLQQFLDRFDAFMNAGEGGGDAMAHLSEQFTGVFVAQYQEVNIQVEANLQVVKQEDGTLIIREAAAIQQADPLILDLDGDGIEVSDVRDGVWFDINGDGVKEKTAFVTGGDAFLALDRNQNGRIDGGHELFGDQHGATDGIEELRKFDSNQDGVIDSKDGIFSSLLLFEDKNWNGESDEGELRTLAEANIVAIDLNKTVTQKSINGNMLTAYTTYQRSDGQHRLAGDVLLNFIG